MKHKDLKNSDNRLYRMSWIAFIIYLLYRVVLVFYPQPDVGGVEGNIVYFIQRLLDGQPLYTDPEIPPYAIAQYTPLYYYLVAGLAKITGVQPDNVLGVFMMSRIAGLFLNLMLMGIVFRICRTIFEIPRDRSFCVAVLAFIFLEITSFSRPDSLYHVLFMISLLFFLRFVKMDINARGGKLLFLFSLFAVAAIFAKQSAFLLPLLAGGWFMIKKQFRALITFGVWYAVLLAVVLTGIYLSGSFPLFYKNTVTGINNGISPGWFNSVIMPGFYYGFGLVFVLAGVFLLFVIRKEKQALMQVGVYLLILLFICNNTLAIKNGSNPGYFTEWWILVFILCAKYWPVIKERSAASSNLPGWLLGAVLVMKVLLLAAPVFSIAAEATFTKRKEVFEAQKSIAVQLAADDKNGGQYFVFTNFNTAESFFSNLLFRHAVMPQMDVVALAAYPQKKYDYSDFKRRLKSGEFRWMIMRQTGPQKQFFEISLEGYILRANTRGYNIYEYQYLPEQ